MHRVLVTGGGGQLAQAFLGMMLAAFHGAMDGLVVLFHDTSPPCDDVARLEGAVSILPG